MTSSPNLESLYTEHPDRTLLSGGPANLRQYERIFGALRDKPVSLLEIGSAHESSLEFWSRYFPKAERIIAWDEKARPDRSALRNARLTFVEASYTSEAARSKLANEARGIDIVIDHAAAHPRSTQGVFARVFPLLADDGVYVVADLQESYREESGGGFYVPDSPMAFFKRLLDTLNFEHCSGLVSRAEALRTIALEHGVAFLEEDLASIHSVEFVPTMCVIRKTSAHEARVGMRLVSNAREANGVRAQVLSEGRSFRRDTPEHVALAHSRTSGAQTLDALSRVLLSRELELTERNRELVISVARIAELETTSDKLELERTQLKQRLDHANKQLKKLKQDFDKADRALKGMRKSPTWRYTRLFRVAGGVIKRRREALRMSRFDPEFYKANNPDVAQSGVDPKQHYLRFGKKEGRKGGPEELLSAQAKRVTQSVKLGGAYELASRRARKVLRQKGLWGATKHLVGLVSSRGKKSSAQAKKAPAPARTPTPNAPTQNRDRRHDYAEWLRRYDTLTAEDRAAYRVRAAMFKHKPTISVLMPTYKPDPRWLIEAIESVRDQIYPHWELCIADDASGSSKIKGILDHFANEDPRIRVTFRNQNGHISAASNTALELARGDFVALLDHDDLLRPHALFWVAEALNQNPGLKLLYSDEDKIDEKGTRSSPYFKCEFNEELFRSHNMICHLGVYRTELVREVGGFRTGFEGAQDYDLALRCRERISVAEIHHVPRVLYSWRVHAQSTAHSSEAKPYAVVAGEHALNEHFARLNLAAHAEANEFSMYRTRYALPKEPPLVSLIIPTRNAASLVRQCIESIIERTTYRNFEILLIDNGSDDSEALSYFAELAKGPYVRVLRDDRPFNYSALNNSAVQEARGELVCLVNNDIEVISPDWLSEMVSIALQPGVGAVGARLWYPNNTLQHGGVVLGILGVAGHSHKHLPKGQHGYFARAALTQSLSAVTGACLLLKKAIYQEVGGLNDTDLKVAFNDVDFCLRVREAGYRNVWTPYAELYHHESATRGFEDTPEKKERFARETRFMRKRWGEALAKDPAYSPNLTLQHEDFSLAFPPRVPGMES